MPEKKKINPLVALYLAPMFGGALFWIVVLAWAVLYGLMLGVGALVGR
jgi:hypothetical protein